MLGEEGFVTRIQTLYGKTVTSEAYQDENGKPVPINGDTYCKVEYTYDKAGNRNREKYYGADEKPILCSKGYAIIYREFNSRGQVVYEKFYGTDGFATMLEDGAVSHRYTYDENGNLLSVKGYDFYDHEVEAVDGN